MEQNNQGQHSPLCNLSQVQMFGLGVVSGLLVLCTIGFFILLNMVIKGGQINLGGSDTNVAENNVPSPSVPAGNDQPQPSGPVPPVDVKNDNITGGKNATVTLIEYSDFECPFCGKYYPTVKQAISEYGDKIRVVFRHFPLSFHPQAMPAALASECAGEQGKFWEYHDKLFENQTSLNADLYKKLAGDLRLNVSKFNDCVSTQKYLKKVQDQQSAGGAAGVQGTPHTIVMSADGQSTVVSGAQPYTNLKAAIDSLMK